MDAATRTLADTPLLQIRQASVMRDHRRLLDRIDLDVANGQHTAILGANGAGKSTLVQLIARQVYPLARDGDRGTVRVFGRERWNVAELRGLLGIVSPALQRDYTGTTGLEVFDAVVSGFFATRGIGLDHVVSENMRRRAREALQRLGAAHLVGRRMTSLSTGEARRVLIARALVHRPRALLLDEPCAGLDLASRRRFLETLRLLARDGTTLLLVTHHIEEIVPEIEQVLLLYQGRIQQQGDKRYVLTDELLGRTFDMPVHVEHHQGWYHARID